MTSKSTVQVAVRTRPSANFASDNLLLNDVSKSIRVKLNKKVEKSYLNNQRDDYLFKFDNVLHNASQDGVYEASAKDIAESTVDGYNGTIMAYGQTGSGKTFTMTGPHGDYRQRGLIPRSISQVFQAINDRPERAYSVRVSYMEIYNEQVFDLLGDSNERAEDLQVMEDSTGITFIRGLSHIVANGEEEALSLMFDGETNRVISEHQMNKRSSRSHCIATLHIESQSRVESDGSTRRSKLNLVDLAGSERVGKTGSSGQVLKEAMYINRSLTYLEQVVIALSTKNREHIPYRQSKLTYYLKDSIGGNCRTLMVANIWGERTHLDETVSTLRFASRMMRVSNEAIVNVVLDSGALIKRYERQIRELKQELAMHDQLKGEKALNYDEYGDEQRLDLRRTIRSYMNDEAEELEIKNLRQVREIFAQFKVICRGMAAETEEKIRSSYDLQKRGQSGHANGAGNGQSTAHGNEDGVGDDDHDQGFGVGNAVPNDKFKAKKPTGSSPSTRAAAQSKKLPKEETDASADLGVIEETLETDGPPKKIVSKNEAYDEYKKTVAMDAMETLKTNNVTLTAKRKELKEFTQKVNDAKKEIDEIKGKIDLKNQEKDTGDSQLAHVVDEEENVLFQNLKDAKKRYRDAYDDRKMIKSEYDYVTKVIDTTRQRLLREFGQWYEDKYSDPEEKRQRMERIQLETQRQKEIEQLDDSEKFEVLELERMKKQDPESLVYFRAQRRTETNKALARMKRGAN